MLIVQTNVACLLGNVIPGNFTLALTLVILIPGLVVLQRTELFGHVGHEFHPWHKTVSIRLRMFSCLQRKPCCLSSPLLVIYVSLDLYVEIQRQGYVVTRLCLPNLDGGLELDGFRWPSLSWIACVSRMTVTAKFEPKISVAHSGLGIPARCLLLVPTCGAECFCDSVGLLWTGAPPCYIYHPLRLGELSIVLGAENSLHRGSEAAAKSRVRAPTRRLSSDVIAPPEFS